MVEVCTGAVFLNLRSCIIVIFKGKSLSGTAPQALNTMTNKFFTIGESRISTFKYNYNTAPENVKLGCWNRVFG
jgi:hypothetical protein